MLRHSNISEPAAQLLTEETWERNYPLIFSTEYLMAECELSDRRQGRGGGPNFAVAATCEQSARLLCRHALAAHPLHHFGSV